ncbi:spermidine synthase [Amycolatopsis sp. PS_44_ISF1]|uniref:spermidine synthase n=1 Tax=Amycolatopsis sp. PS_44_ISF1 TaxID=2974917 RepID=UPI0028DF871C|nr:spermidine synthase [Amycolatopsis sp. PS_44_ISF1]MDT8913165.1 spermidine synthase [Amycolatopsis sp. PS_44_ISF1]
MDIEEPLGEGLTRVWSVPEVLADARTAYQHVVIGRTAQGVSLFCDDERQSTEFSQLVYHEALLVPALLLAERVDRVLVIGSSEGVVCRIAVAAGASVVDHVDIDAEAVRLCAEHLPYGYSPDELAAAERGEGAIRVHYADGWEFVRSRTGPYDIVLVDLPDERDGTDAQHNRLYGTEFLQRCRALLAPGGVVAGQGGCPTLWRHSTLVRCWRRFTETFRIPVYFGSDEHEWAFFFGSDADSPEETMARRLPTLGYRPETIDELSLRGSLVPPISLRR